MTNQVDKSSGNAAKPQRRDDPVPASGAGFVTQRTPSACARGVNEDRDCSRSAVKRAAWWPRTTTIASTPAAADRRICLSSKGSPSRWSNDFGMPPIRRPAPAAMITTPLIGARASLALPLPRAASCMITALPSSTLWVVMGRRSRAQGGNGRRTGGVVLRIGRHGETDPVHQPTKATLEHPGQILVTAAHQKLIEHVIGKRGRHLFPAPLASEGQQALPDAPAA